MGKESDGIAFGIDEPEVQKHYAQLKDFFLGASFDKSKLFLDALQGNSKQTPPPSDEDLFAMALEYLLEWAGVSLSSPFNKQTVDQFIDEFEKGIGVKPVEVTFIPVFGINNDSGFWKEQRYKLCDKVEFGFLNRVDREFLVVEVSRTGKMIEAPSGFANILPYLCLVVRRPAHVSHEVIRPKIDLAIQNFRVFCGGIWGADIGREV